MSHTSLIYFTLCSSSLSWWIGFIVNHRTECLLSSVRHSSDLIGCREWVGGTLVDRQKHRRSNVGLVIGMGDG